MLKNYKERYNIIFDTAHRQTIIVHFRQYMLFLYLINDEQIIEKL